MPIASRALRHPPGEMERNRRTREAVYVDWLERQFERLGGASLVKCKTDLAAFRRTRGDRPPAVRYGAESGWL